MGKKGMRAVSPLLMLICVFALLSGTVFASSYTGVLLSEGEQREFLSASDVYLLKVVTVSDESNKVVFSLNGELSDALGEREQHRFTDSSLVVVADILANEGAETTGGDLVQFYFVTGSRDSVESGEYDLSSLSETASLVTEDATVSVDSTSLPSECIASSNCNDDNPCSTDRCVSGECVHEFVKGCALGERCVPSGEVVTNDGRRYCSTQGTFILQKADGASCVAAYECVNSCVDQVCATVVVDAVRGAGTVKGTEVAPPQSRGIWGSFVDWLRSWF